MKSIRLVCSGALFAAAVTASPLLAYGTAAKAPAAAPATTNDETVTIDAKKSVVKWVGSKIVGDKHNGTIGVKSGDVTFKNGAPTSGKVTIDMATIKNEDVTDAKSNKKLVGHLNSDDFFDVKKFPEATLVMKTFTSNGTDTWTVAGDMTIRGVTKPVTMDAKVVKNEKGTQQITTAFKFDRTEWNVRYGSGKFFKELVGDRVISDEISIEAEIFMQAASFRTASR